MLFATFLISFVLSAIGITITEPEDWTAYNLDEFPDFRAMVENENEVPDSVAYTLNGGTSVIIPKLNTDWPTYMQNYLNHGFSESYAPTMNSVLWSAAVTGTSHEFPTPVVYEGLVYYPQDNGGEDLYALNAATGEVEWIYEGTGDTDDAVTIVDDLLYTASDSIWCINALTGARVWASGIADYGGSTPIVSDGQVFCGVYNFPGERSASHVCSLDALTGELIWCDTLSGNQASCMALWNGYLFVPTRMGPLYAIDSSDGTILWENWDSDGGYWDSSPTVVDGVVYTNGYDGITRGIDALTGNTIWEHTSAPLVITATPAYHDSRLYFADEEYSYRCLIIETGTELWTKFGTSQHGSSGIADGIVFYGETKVFGTPDSARVVALDCNSGAEVWSFSTGTSLIYHGFQSSPSITDGVMYYACTDGYLYAFGTGLKYTYLDDTLNPEVGWNELVATSFDNGVAAASDTVHFYINPTGIEFEPSRKLLLTGSPNPFFLSTELSFSLSEPGFTSVEIYDLTGRCISNIIESDLSRGDHTVNWDGTDQHGESVSAGLYLCRIQSGGVIETTGLCLLR